MATTAQVIPVSAPRDSLKHIASLDGIRGLAIAMVLVNHLLWSSPQTGSRLMDFVAKIRAGGWIGVDLFFALSGFLITGILFDTLNTGHYFKNFYARRALRIFPLYYGVLLVLFIVFRPTHWTEGRQLYVILVYLQNTPLWWNGSQSRAIKDVTGHLWSLAVEEQFYLVWPVLIFWIRDRRKLLWTAVALATVAPIARTLMLHHGAPAEATYKMTICRADSLLTGAWLALAVRGERRETVLRFALPVFCLAMLLCGVIAWRSGSFDWEGNYAINAYGYSLLAIAGTSLIAMALSTGSLTSRLMHSSLLRWLGKYSYGIYIFHMLVSFVYPAFLHAHIHSKVVLHIAVLVCNLAITLPLAWLSYHFYEQPFLRLKRHFNYSSADSVN
jgi:peptidoglycan/LPS O-acetylase OafA/YrhL